MTRPLRRCAIYTRKSSEEGLEQDFNSLDAQHEACASYINSQAGEGWRAIKSRFDDGGFSGGTMERPSLMRLLAAVDAGEVDTIVVYKVDRLTRSLSDFARIVERLDARGVSFVSVTQAFNTTTSMGRLTLNVLLSFAQFEREVTGERIRDKIAASKAKGMWMGGTPPLGYLPNGRSLIVEESEAETVRFVFRRYLELGSVHALQADLEQRHIRSKRWTTKKGRQTGGAVLARGALYHLLRNRIYRGEIPHRGKHYAGQHPPIVDAALFDAVQLMLADNRDDRVNRPYKFGGSPLTGLLFDANGDPMSPTHARGRSGTHHWYYVSKTLLTGDKKRAPLVARVAAQPIEAVILDRLSTLVAPDEFTWSDIRSLVERITLDAAGIDLTLAAAMNEQKLARVAERASPNDALRLDDSGACVWRVPLTIKQRGGVVRILNQAGRLAVDERQPDRALVQALARGHRYRNLLARGVYRSAIALAKTEGVTKAIVYRYLSLAYLAPDLTREILDGRQRPGLSVRQLLAADIPLDWTAQRRLLSSAA